MFTQEEQLPLWKRKCLPCKVENGQTSRGIGKDKGLWQDKLKDKQRTEGAVSTASIVTVDYVLALPFPAPHVIEAPQGHPCRW